MQRDNLNKMAEAVQASSENCETFLESSYSEQLNELGDENKVISCIKSNTDHKCMSFNSEIYTDILVMGNIENEDVTDSETNSSLHKMHNDKLNALQNDGNLQHFMKRSLSDSVCPMAVAVMGNQSNHDYCDLQYSMLNQDIQCINKNSEQLLETSDKIFDLTASESAEVAYLIKRDKKLTVEHNPLNANRQKFSGAQSCSKNMAKPSAAKVRMKNDVCITACFDFQKSACPKSNNLKNLHCIEKTVVGKYANILSNCLNSTSENNGLTAVKKSDNVVTSPNNSTANHLESSSAEIGSSDACIQGSSVDNVCRVFQNLYLKFNIGEQKLHAKEREKSSGKTRDDPTKWFPVSTRFNKCYNYDFVARKNMNHLPQDLPWHYDKLHQCNQCCKSFRSWVELQDHQRLHDGSWPYKCKMCNAVFQCYRHFQGHNEVHDHNYERKWHARYRQTKKSVKCQSCGALFLNKIGLTFHKLIHVSYKPRNCLLCSSNFHLPEALRNHMSRVHNTIQEFVCHQCGLKFKRRLELADHEYMHLMCISFLCKK